MKAPTTADLIEAVRERMDEAVERPIGGFEARVVRNVLAIVERELALGQSAGTRRRSLVTSYGADNEEVLARQIRSGSHDEAADELRQELLVLAEMQLDIDNPRWLPGSGAGAR